MKIALTIYPLDNLGGICSNTENLMHGLKEIGHSVDFFLLSWQKKFINQKITNKQILEKDGWYQGALFPVHQMHGWYFPYENKIPYRGLRNLRKAESILRKYDLVIWIVPVPTRKKANKGNCDWVRLYKANSNNVVYSHDAHMPDRYPYLYEIKDYTNGIACTNYASYKTVQVAGVQKALIFSSHDTKKYKQKFSYERRASGFLSLQTFKKWKHVDDLVRAIPYMDHMKKYIAGGGLELAYMQSKEKCKEEYFCSHKLDPNLPKGIGKEKLRIWDYAFLHYKMEYLGWITPKKRDLILQKVKTLIDPSWSLSFAKHGDHFNRVATDACLNGNILIARNYGITSNAEGDGLIFKADRNYIMIPHNATPREFAEIVNDAQYLPRKKWKEILGNNFELTKQFDRCRSAQSFINLSQGKPAGYFDNKIVCPSSTPPKIIANSAKAMKEFFGGKVHRSNEGITKLL